MATEAETLNLNEEEEFTTESTGTKKKGTKKKVATKKKKAVKAKSTDAEAVAPKEEETLPGLPPQVEGKKIRCTDPMDKRSYANVDMSAIKATTKTIYVHDIHDANPQHLEEEYGLLLTDSRFVYAKTTKEDYEKVVKEKKVNHHITVVDCSVFPTLSYGFTSAKLANGEFPNLAEIEAMDVKFRQNPTGYHNPSIIARLVDKQVVEDIEPANEIDDEDEFDFVDFDESDDEDQKLS